jgi:purine-binding chemotaxis protein CheW
VQAEAPVVAKPVAVVQTISPATVANVIEPPSLFREGPFQSLFFRAGGLEFVVPLLYLDAIIRWQSKPTKLPGQPSWHRGVLEYRDRNMALVDFAQLVMPGQGPNPAAPGYILSIEDGRFGLVCDSILKPEPLVYEQVQWRSSRPDRGWLAGIVRERLASVVDIEELRLLLLPNRKWHG